MGFSAQDESFMGRAIELARLGEGNVSPNPMVSAVIVKGRKIIAEGWHKKFGGPHAEIAALKAAKRPVSGATLYVNLEPCSHLDKKTPPCVPAIINAGISRVVIGMKDPNPRVCGRGVLALKSAKIKVDVGCLKTEAVKLNERFIKWITNGFPYVGMKVAMSLDGKIATKSGESKWITSEESRNFVRNLRNTYDAILVGINTVMADDPILRGTKKEPLRVILDSRLRISLNANVLRDTNVVIATTKRANKPKLALLQKRGIILKVFKSKIKLVPLLRFLGKRGVGSVLVEGGAEIFGSFVDGKFVDRFYCFVAPKIIGGRDAKSAIGGEGTKKLKNSLKFSNLTMRKIGPDILIKAVLREPQDDTGCLSVWL